jgi:hypothetical protein
VPTHVVSREMESGTVSEFLASVPSGPSALVIEGRSGHREDHCVAAALERAQSAGFEVLSTRAVQTESVLAYTQVTACR